MGTGKQNHLAAEARAFLERRRDLKFLDAFVTDLNGVLRGKRLRAKSAAKLFELGLRLPRSALATDIWGGDVHGSGLVVDTGDRDGLCVPVETGLQPVPWAAEPTGQVLTMMREGDGTPFAVDPRQLLLNMSSSCRKLGFSPVAALELEFFLLSPDLDVMGRPALPPSTGEGRRIRDGRVYAMEELDAHAAFFDDLYAACDQQGLPLDSAVVEAGPGQFEVNLMHQDDVVRAADHAILLRRAIKGVAARHDRLASFMAKPFMQLPGNGLHVHLSILDEGGENIFDDGSPGGSERLRQAIAGLIATAPEAMIFFAPHLNSTRRFQSSSHAPTRASWGYDNRTAAIRVPVSASRNRRFEHRIAGADANPYLVLASILAGLLHGVESRLEAPPPVDGNAYEEPGTELVVDWAGALKAFSDGPIVTKFFGPVFSRVFRACKEQEMRIAAARITDFEYDSYLRTF